MIVGIMGFARTGKNTTAEILKLRGLEIREPFADIAFADELKRVVMRMYGFTEEQSWGVLKDAPDHRYPREHEWRRSDVRTATVWVDGRPSKLDEDALKCACCRVSFRQKDTQCYLTPRYAQQIVGTEGFRHCFSNTWVMKAIHVAEDLVAGGHSYHRVVGLSKSPATPPLNVVLTDTRFINEFEGIKACGGKVYRIKRAGYEKPAHDHPSETEQLKIPDDRLDGVINNDGDLEDLEREVLRVVLGR